MKVKVFKIKYKDNTTYWNLSGPNAVEAWCEHGILNVYNSKTAPTEIEVDIPDTATIMNVQELVQKQVEEDTGLQVESFSCRIPISILDKDC